MHPQSASITSENMILATDFYQLTMIAAYYQYALEHDLSNAEDRATFELFVRQFPKNRNYLVAAGLEQVVHFLTTARFTESTIDFLKKRPEFRKIDERFFSEFLPNFRFDLDVWAIEEGQFFFPHEPILRVQGPTIAAQLVETYIISAMNYQTIVASKAARVRSVAEDKILLEFGTRRSHSPQAGLYAARASYIGGFNGTSNVTADYELGIPASGTMAHSFVQKFGEMESFRIYSDIYQEKTILLIDTYDIRKGTEKATQFQETLQGVRIDSGDPIAEAKKVRKILDENNCENVGIVLSSNLDEYSIQTILAANTPIWAFGVGTEIVTSSDDPTLSLVYKMVEANGEPTMKTSEGKLTYPGAKQIYRIYDNEGIFDHDILALASENQPQEGTPLLRQVMNNGELIGDLPTVNKLRENCLVNCQKIPLRLKSLSEVEIPPLHLSESLLAVTNGLLKKHGKTEIDSTIPLREFSFEKSI